MVLILRGVVCQGVSTDLVFAQKRLKSAKQLVSFIQIVTHLRTLQGMEINIGLEDAYVRFTRASPQIDYGPRLTALTNNCFVKWTKESRLKCPKHTHQVSFMGQFAGADIQGCGLQECYDRFGKQSQSVDECNEACRENAKCKSFTFAPVSGDRNWPGKSVCTLYADTIPNTLWPNVDGDYFQIMCVIRIRAHKIKSQMSCERKAQLGIIMKTNSPEECAAEILSDPSKCSTGTFMLQKSYSWSWGCRCCAKTGWTPHPHWSIYKVDVKKNALMLSSSREDVADFDVAMTKETSNEMSHDIISALIGFTSGIFLVFLYIRCRSRSKYGNIQLDSTRLNHEVVA